MKVMAAVGRLVAIGARSAVVMALEQAVFHLDDLRISPAERAVFRGEERLPLSKLDLELLLALIDAAPAALTHLELMESVWHGKVIALETVSQRVRLLRQALGDDARAPRYVRGLRGVGYQLVPPVRQVGETPLADVSPLAQARAPLTPDSGLALPETFVGKEALLPTIAVLPFAYDGSDQRGASLALGLSQELTTRLARTKAALVAARGSVERFRPGQSTPAEVGFALGVRYVLQARLVDHRKLFDLHLALVDAERGAELWAEQLTLDERTLADRELEIAEQLAASLQLQLEHAEQQRALQLPDNDIDAWSAFHRGTHYMYHYGTESLDLAEHWLRQAQQRAPKAARIHASLSWVFWQRAFLGVAGNRADNTRRVVEHAEESVRLDRWDPLAHWALGRARLLLQELDASVEALTMAAELNPSFAVGRYSLAFAQLQAGELSVAKQHAATAERLSPLDPVLFLMQGARGFALTLEGDFDAGADVMLRASRLANTHYQLSAKTAVACALADRLPEAQAALGRVRAERPDYTVESFLGAFSYREPSHLEMIRSAFDRLVAP